MKLKPNNVPLWNRLKKTATGLAALALLGTLTTSQAQITYTPVFSNVWVVAAGTYTDLPANNGNNVRGIAISPVTTNVLYPSTTSATNAGTLGAGANNHFSTVSFASGSNYLAQSKTSPNGAQVNLSNLRVSDDGYVYGCNVTTLPTGANQVFQVFRWNSETDVANDPIIVFATTNVFAITNISATSFQWRIGDYMDLRGGGINTEIVVVGNGGAGANVSSNFVVLRATDASATFFTNFSITIPGAAASALGGRGVTFEGTNNVVYINNGSALRRVTYTPGVMTSATVTSTNGIDVIGIKYLEFTNGVKLIAGVKGLSAAGATQTSRVYRLDGTTPTQTLSPILNSNLMPVVATSQNGNAVGQVDAKNGYIAFGAPGHGLNLFAVGFTTQAPPSTPALTISANTVVQGYPVTLTAAASGSAPLTFQFIYTNTTTTNILQTATNTTYNIASVQAANVGAYYFIVTNLYGRATSSVVNLGTVLPGNFSRIASNSWTLAGGSRPYITSSGDTQRGLGFDPINNVLVLVSRTPTNGIHLLSATNGADLGEMDLGPLLTFTPPGTFALNMCGVAEDGAVFVGNLITSGNSDTFKIYRWSNADTVSAISEAYSGNPLAGEGANGRIGDTMAVRGSGTSTEIICSFRFTNCVAIFTTGDGVNFTPTIVTVTNMPVTAGGLGVAWGSGTNFWVKSGGWNLRRVSYDLSTGIGKVEDSNLLPDPEAALSIDTANKYAAILAYGEFPQNVALYDITDSANSSVTSANVVDRELFAASNVNGNGTGSVVFDVAGGRIFALNSNNGIIALTYASRPVVTPTTGGSIISWTGPGVLQSTPSLTGTWTDVVGTSPYTNTGAAALFFRVKR